MRSLFIVLVLTFAAISPSCADTKLECELVGAILETEQGSSGPQPQPLYIASETGATIFGQTFESFQKDWKNLKAETFSSFKANNQVSVAVDCAGVKPAGRDVIIVTDGKRPEQETIHSLSRAGVSTDGTQALLYFDYFCGPLCAGGSLFLFEKQSGTWIVAGQRQMWVS